MDENEMTLKTEELDKAAENSEDFTSGKITSDEFEKEGLFLKPDRSKFPRALKIIAFTLCGVFHRSIAHSKIVLRYSRSRRFFYGRNFKKRRHFIRQHEQNARPRGYSHYRRKQKR